MIICKIALFISFLQLAPLEGFESDEELSLLAKVLMAYMAQALLQPETIPIVLGSLQQVRGCSH